jgi:hypothetical protein
VITQQPRGTAVLGTKTATFSVKATGPGLSYQWFHKGSVIPGATTSTLTVSNASHEAAGAYTCTARNSAGWVTSHPAMLIVILRPVINPFNIQDLVVGQPFRLQITATNNPTSFTIKGLPKGLTMDTKTGIISGRPLEINPRFTAEVIASNRAGASARTTDDFSVSALPAALSESSYSAPLGRAISLNNLLGGSVRFQVTTLGGITGTVTLGNARPLRVAAVMDTSRASPTAHLIISRRGLATLHIHLTLDATSRTCIGEISDGQETLPFVAHQPLTTAGSITGDYTMALSIDDADVGDETVPQGYSIGGLKISATGAATGVLILADNSQVTFGGSLEQAGQLTLHRVLYKGAGSVLGLISIDADTGDLAMSEISWLKHAVAKDLVYGKGFGPLQLSTLGRKYSIPSATELPLRADAGAGNAALSFAQGGAPDPATRLNTTALEIEATKVTLSLPNPGNVRMVIDAGRVGRPFLPGVTASFRGSFDLTDADNSLTPARNLNRKADFKGMIVDDGTELKGYGFFILPKMPTSSPRTTLRTAPRLSGSVLLETVSLLAD